MSTSPDHREPVRIGVVIPYFQRDAGLLHRALASVAHQDHPPVQVVVVDDGSPVAASEEITPELRRAFAKLTVIRQDNAGAAAARNAGLRALATEVTAVAFLDSDDYWEPEHLRNAAAALALGADFFFANFLFEGATRDYFQVRPSAQRELLCDSPLIEGTPGIGRWTGTISTLFGHGLPFSTSMVVFRRSLRPRLRFPEDYRRAGEDYAVFWELLTHSALIMFGTQPTVTYSRSGVGIYKHATFGGREFLVRTADEVRWWRGVVGSELLTSVDRRLIRDRIAVRRREALMNALHLLRRRHNVLKELIYLFRSDPLCALAWGLDLPELVYTKLRGRPLPARFTL